LDDRNLGASLALGFVALAGFLASSIFAAVQAQIADHELRIRATEIAIASRYQSATPEGVK